MNWGETGRHGATGRYEKTTRGPRGTVVDLRVLRRIRVV